MTRRPVTTAFWMGRLPHWEVEGGRYFVTMHLAGAIPLQGRLRLKHLSQELRSIDRKDEPRWFALQRAIFGEMETWLDQAEWNVKLADPDVVAMVTEAIEFRTARRDWHLFEYVVMPTHLHLFGEIGDRGLKATLEDFKRWTGHQAVEILGDDGRFWQREWFDHWSRSDEEDARTVAYIRNNPRKAGLVPTYQAWPYGSW